MCRRLFVQLHGHKLGANRLAQGQQPLNRGALELEVGQLLNSSCRVSSGLAQQSVERLPGWLNTRACASNMEPYPQAAASSCLLIIPHGIFPPFCFSSWVQRAKAQSESELTTDAYVGVVLAEGGTQRGDGAHNLKLLCHDLQQGCEEAAGSWPNQAMP